MERPNTRVRPGSWSAAHPNEGDNEQWKGSPSRETTHDRGTDARVASDHAHTENIPSARREPRSRGPGSRRRATRH
jgi:hypothetical protein